MRVYIVPIAVSLLAAAAGGPLWAGEPMSSSNNSLLRNDVNGGSELSTSAQNKLYGSLAEDAAQARTSSVNKVVPGALALFSFPGKVSDLSSPLTLLSSTTFGSLQWSTPGYDGGLGPALQAGTSYYIRVASYTVPDTFAFQFAQPWVSTGPAGTAQGAVVSSVTTGLYANTTWYTTVWTQDADGNVSFTSNRSTFTTLALAPLSLTATYLYVFETSATLNWAALPGPPQASSMSAQGYSLEASSTNFGALTPGGVVYSSATSSVLASTLTVAGLDLGNTYYFRVGSLNWSGQPDYLTLPNLNMQIEPSGTGLSFGSIDARVVESIVSASSIVVVNRGSLPVSLRLFGVPVSAGTPWSLSVSSDVEQAVLQGVWNTVSPPPSSFVDAVVGSTQTSGGLGGLYAGDQAGSQVPPGQSRTLWFRFWRPTTTISTTQQVLRVSVRAVYP